MPSIEVSIRVEGTLPAEEATELTDVGLRARRDEVVLEGTVTDQEALIGVLERLRRAGLQLREVTSMPPSPPSDVAFVTVAGRAADLVRVVLGDVPVTENEATTTAEVAPVCTDVLFAAIERLSGLGLDLREVRVGRSASPRPVRGDR